MKMHTRHFAFLFTCVFLFSNCREEEKAPEIEWNKDLSTQMNERLAQDEDLNIRMYLENRKSWKMNETGTGLRYYIYQQGNGDQAVSGLIAQVRMKVEGLDGTIFKETEKGEIESFMIDKSDIETGLQEGIKKMRIGDKAKLIVPSHLAHGIAGDMEQIPPLTTLIIDVELLGLIAR